MVPVANTETSKQWPIVVKSMKYFWPESNWDKLKVFTSLCFMVLSAAAIIVTPIIWEHQIDSLNLKTVEYTSGIVFIVVYVVAVLLSELFIDFAILIWADISAKQERDIALQTFQHLLSLSLDWHLNRETGKVLRIVNRGAIAFSNMLHVLIFLVCPILLQVIFAVIYLGMFLDWYYAFITTVMIVLYIAFTWFATNWRDKFRRSMNQKDNAFNQIAVDAMLNFATVKQFCTEEHEERRYDTALQNYRRANIDNRKTLSMLNVGQTLIIQFGAFLMFFIGIKQLSSNAITLGTFVMLQTFVLTVSHPLFHMGGWYRQVKQSLVDVESMFEIWNVKSNTDEDHQKAALEVHKGKIEFKDVHFGYKGRNILNGVSFVIPPGTKTAFVGSTGAGKTTIANLIYRFYNAHLGKILIDGQDVSKGTKVSLRKCIGMVPQDCVLFNDTIRYNISYGAFGVNEKEPDMETIKIAAQKANILEFIESLEDGFDTKVGERGLLLSGGEKQRIAIARAYLKHPKIIIFDEATSSLDMKTENELQRTLDDTYKNTTSITIAHRLSTIMNSDQILFLENGTIAESGTHMQLLEKGGKYAQLWKLQEQNETLTEKIVFNKDLIKQLISNSPTGFVSP